MVQRRYRGNMIEVYKISHGFYDEEIKDFLQFPSNDLEYKFRGHCFNLPKVSYKKEMRKFSFRCRVADHCNNIPDLVVNATSFNIFKKQLDKLWEQEGIMYDPDVDIHLRTSSDGIRTQAS